MIGNVIAAALLSAGAVLDVRALSPDGYFATGSLGVAFAAVAFLVAWRIAFFVSWGDGAVATLWSHVAYLAEVVIVGAVQIVPLIAIAQRYLSGRWCPPDPTNPLVMTTVELYLLATLLAAELRIIGELGSSGSWGANTRRSALAWMFLFLIPVASTVFAVGALAFATIPTFAATFPSGLACGSR